MSIHFTRRSFIPGNQNRKPPAGSDLREVYRPNPEICSGPGYQSSYGFIGDPGIKLVRSFSLTLTSPVLEK